MESHTATESSFKPTLAKPVYFETFVPDVNWFLLTSLYASFLFRAGYVNFSVPKKCF